MNDSSLEEKKMQRDKIIIAFYSQRFSTHSAQHTRYIFPILQMQKLKQNEIIFTF